MLFVGTGNPQPVIASKYESGLESLHGIHRRSQCGYRQTGLVFPAVAT